MHELHLASEIIAIVEEEMAKRGLKKVTTVGVKVGTLAGVDPEALSFGFEASVVETNLAGARLAIETIPVSGRCRTCGKNFEVVDYVFICPHCGSVDVIVEKGEEMNISYLIGE